MRPALVTAGATRNPVDAIRYLSAGATGKTGIALAKGLSDRCATTLLGSAEACLRATAETWPAAVAEFGSTRDLMGRMEEWLRSRPNALLVHSAAVGDYEANAIATKIPSGAPELVLRLHPGPKIIDHVRKWAPDCYLCSFKAGSPDWDDARLEAVARAQLERTNSDLVFANRLGELGTSCMILDRTGTDRFASRPAAIQNLLGRLLSQA